MTVVLAVDVGTTTAKAIPFAEHGREVGPAARRPTPIGPDGTASADAVADAVDRLIDDVVPRLARPPDAVAVSTVWHTLVGVDHRSRPTTDLTTWLDGRSALEASELRRVLDDDDVRQRTGAPFHPSLPPARLAWTRRNEPESFAATRRWCSLPEHLATRWFGEVVGPSPSIASASGLYDQRRRAWDADVLEALRVQPASLATVDDSPRCGLGAEYRSRWPVLAACPWFPAVGDGAAAVVAAGGASPDRAALTVGTSAAARVLVPVSERMARPVPRSLFAYLLDSEHAVVGGARSNAGNVVAWAEERLRLHVDDVAAATTEGREPGSHGLDVDSSLVVEWSPDWPLTSGGRIAGVTRSTSGLDIAQALLEDAALGVAAVVDAVEAWAGPRLLVVGGGASRSEAWCRLLADTAGRSIVRSPVAEASAWGAAAVVFRRLGVAPAISAGAEQRVEPDPARTAAFRRLKGAHRLFGASWGP